MKSSRKTPPLLLGLCCLFLAAPMASAASCASVVAALNASLSPKIDEAELTDILQTLNNSHNQNLPAKFVTKRQAGQAGWRRGHSLWSVPALKGKSIGGDRFFNNEGLLPQKSWREADLGYNGENGRNSKRIVFSTDGMRQVTVDHYQSFHEVQACQ